MSTTTKPVNQKAWFLILPVIICVAFSAILPLMTVVNYSVQDIISPERRVFVGTEWFAAVMRDEELHAALWRQITFSLSVLAVEIPLGIALALSMPAAGWKASAVLVLVALSLLIPWNVVGTIWQIYGRADIGLMGRMLQEIGIEYSYTGNATQAWLTVLLMDVWHWTPLVALLAFAGLRSIPDAYYQAARIDGASKFAVFRYIQLPKMRGVLMIAVLLRFMDSFMIYTEPFVLTGGGPGNATTFLSQYLTTKAVGQFDLGPAAAFSLIYFFIILLLCFAGLRSIPDAYYQAARIDGASKFAVFRYIQLPKMRGVLMIAVLLRFMDSFMIYTEPFVLTGGGPGNATTFLSQYLTQKAVGQFDLGPAAAFSLIYFLIILLVCFILYNWMQRVGTQEKEATP